MKRRLKRICCDTCRYSISTTRKGCGLFKDSKEVWDKCLGGSDKIKVPKGWVKPMEYAYVYWKPYYKNGKPYYENDILPDDLFDI